MPNPVPAQPPIQPRRRRWGLRFSLFFLATTVVLGFSTWWLVSDDRGQRRNLEDAQAQLRAAQQQVTQDAASLRAYAEVVAAPDTVSVTLQQQPGGPPGQAHVLYNARLGLAVYSGQLSPAPAGKIYQLWVIPSTGAAVNAGQVAANQQSGAVVIHLEQGISAKSFAVTVEPAGGSPAPTGSKVLVGTVNG